MPRNRNIINPGAGPVDIQNIDAFLAFCDPDDPPYVDLGGDMVVPLAELLETQDQLAAPDDCTIVPHGPVMPPYGSPEREAYDRAEAQRA